VFVATNLTRGEEVAMDTLGDDGFEVTGEGSDDAFGGELARAGDVNGDDLDDFVVGAPHASEDSGAAYVIFGGSDSKDIDVGELGDRGITLTGGNGTTAGASLAGLGDVNGDGRADIAVGAPTATPDGRGRAGVAYVVFGRGAGGIELPALGDGGFRIDGPTAGTPQTELFQPGLAGELSAAGDVNGDATPDLAISASEIDDGTDLAYVVYGKSSTTRVDLSKPGGEAAALDGEAGAVMTFGSGVDFDGDKVFELPFSLGGDGVSTSNGYLLDITR
jgi:glycosylphosphatidylinositol phospholipase D